jgi:hypothetical protein
VFDKYFSLPAAIARHESAPLARERERFLTHLEAGGTGRQTIRTAACYLLRVIQILGLRRLRDVTPKEVEHAANPPPLSPRAPKSKLIEWKGPFS